MNPSRAYAIERIGSAFFDRPGIDQYLVLSMLLHVFMIVALGDTRGGDSRSGARGQGSILVTLDAPLAQERIQVRAGPQARSTVDAPPRAAPVQVPAAAPATPIAPTPVQVPAALEPVAPPKVDTAFTDAPAVPASAFRAESLAPVAPPSATAAFAEAPAVPEAVHLPAPLAPVAPAALSTEFAKAPELKPAERPALSTLPPILAPVVKEIAQSAPAASGVRVQTPAPLPRLEAPAVRAFASPAQAQALETPSALAEPLAPLAPVAPARVEREFATPEFARRADVAVEVPPALEKVATPKVEKEFAPAREYARAEPERPAPDARPPAATPAAPPARDTTAAAVPSSGESAIVSPRADPRLPTFSTPPPASLPRTDLDGLKDRARQIAREGTGPRTAIPFFTAPPPPKKEVEKAFDKALKRPECKDAYADLGLAAIVPLVRDALTEKGCKW
ncbi:MAG: hypothetical protein JNK75_14030 [Betaproteobacteria bacterium]|nr:hypothetical protein [Betaproteobacteria bacterium]